MVLDSPLTRKLTAFAALSESDLSALTDIHRRRRGFPVGRRMIQQGQPNQAVYILAEGWVCSYILLPSGFRQVVDFQIPGDLLGLRAVLLGISDRSFEPVTPVEATALLTGDLLYAIATTPRLAAAVLWVPSREKAVMAQHLVGMTWHNAGGRMAHFLLELAARLRLVGLSDRAGYDCPLTQYHMADALGISAIHVNRVLRALREAGMVTFHNGHVTFDDFDGLVAFADFDRAYLDLNEQLLQ